MKRLLGLMTAVLLFSSIGEAKATTVVVNFDDLTGFANVPNGYGGINWNNDWSYYDEDQPPYNPKSGLTRIFPASTSSNRNGAGETVFEFITPEVFDGAWFSGYSFVNFNLYSGGNLVATSGTLATSSVPTFLSSGYNGVVDKVAIFSNDNSFYVVDDITYQTTSVTAVPEPATMTMLGIGVAGMFGYGLRRRRANTEATPA